MQVVGNSYTGIDGSTVAVNNGNVVINVPDDAGGNNRQVMS